ncbi:Dipeptidyl aminopeptidase [Irineochytrium annulatum]|nr:Dipeptidyl aminopeptidase [Irineochytrium annulatum]
MPTEKPYGAWDSPISIQDVVKSGVRITEVITDPVRKEVYIVEGRPEEKGRSTLLKLTEKREWKEVVTPKWNVRSSVHEYGGAPAAVRDGLTIWTDFYDRLVYMSRDGDPANAVAVTPTSATKRFADFAIHPSGNHLVCVMEDHVSEQNVVNALVVIDLSGAPGAAEPVVVAQGRDFYAAPRFSGSGDKLAWIEWDLPLMQWALSDLLVAPWSAGERRMGAPGGGTFVGKGNHSFSQPRWNGETLYVACDRSGFYNLYRYDPAATAAGKDDLVPLTPEPVEGDFSGPDWVFGAATYGFLDDGRVVAGYSVFGAAKVGVFQPGTGKLDTISNTHMVKALVVVAGKVFMLAGTARSALSVSEMTVDGKEEKILKKSIGIDIDAKYMSLYETLEFPTSRDRTAFAYFYAPKNDDHVAPSGTLPPLIVFCHGGPTSGDVPLLAPLVQFYTSRGFAFLQVQYGGSTGFGRAYRERLGGLWGLVDVEDACAAALYCAETGRADRTKMAVTGGSAGGFTTLACLAFRPEVFACGTSKYGICDLMSLVELTHKFESKDLDYLVGDPTDEALYRERSPIHHADKIKAPLCILQGSDDRVVPVNQAELMRDAIMKKGGVVEYVLFQGEGHGFRQGQNIIKATETEIAFYRKHMRIGM